MILIEKNTVKRKRIRLDPIYINTLIPYFKYRNGNGNLTMPKNCCIEL